MSIFRKRRMRRAMAVGKASWALARPPMIEHGSRDGNESAVRELIELQRTVAAARHRVRRRSEVGTLLWDADIWISAWLDTWMAAEVETPHLHVMYRQMVTHLGRVTDHLATVAEREARRADDAEWPEVDP